MLNSLYRVLSVGLKYWFLLLAAVLAGILVVASRREYRERKALLGRIGQYVGYLEILRGLPQAQGVRIGIAREAARARTSSCGTRRCSERTRYYICRMVSSSCRRSAGV